MLNKKLIIGLTGPIGSGKSLALKTFKTLGAYTVEADKTVHDLYKPKNDGWKLIKKHLPLFINANSTINKKKLANYLFANQKALSQVEKLIHPLVLKKITKEIDRTKKSIIVIEAIKFEKKILGKIINCLILIEASSANILTRNKKYSQKTLTNIIKSFQKPKNIDYRLKNNGTKEDFLIQIENIYQKIIN